jgi:hypothetical protein
MIGFFKSLFSNKQAETKVEEVPYKVETPAVSPVSEKAVEAVVSSIPAEKPAKKKPAGAKKATAKKPRKPKAPKA